MAVRGCQVTVASASKECVERDGTRPSALVCVPTGHSPPSCVPPRHMRQYGGAHVRLLLVSRVPIFTRRVRTHLECVFRPVRRKSSKVERCKLSVIVIHHIQIRGTVRCGAAARREPSGAIGRFATRTLMFTPPVPLEK